MVAVNPCSSFSNLPYPNTVCASVGCQLLSDALTCIAASTPGGNFTGAAISFPVQFVNPNVLTDSFNFQVQVWVQNALSNNPPTWTSIYLGGGIPGYSIPSTFVPSACNNIQQFNMSHPPPVFVPVNDPNGLQAYFNNFVNTNHTLSFNYGNVTFGSTLYSLMGYSNVRNATGVLDTAVSLDPTNNWVIHQLSMDVNTVTDACPFVSEVFTPSGHYYNIPVAVVQRDNANNFQQVWMNFYIAFSLTGTFQSVTATSQFTQTLYQSEITSIQSVCPAGEALIQTVYLMIIGNVFVPNVFVGPRNASDISFTASPQFPGLQNCYGEYVYALQKLGCANSACTTQITSRTRCRPLTTDGQAFNNCSYSLLADQITDVGVGNSYPVALNGVHNFYAYDYLCPPVANATNHWINCTLAVNTPPFPDSWPSNIAITLYPDTVLTVNFDVFAGLLPFPTAPLSTIEVLSQGPNSVISTTDLNNQALSWNGIFTFAIGILNPQLIARGCNLTLDTATLFRIDPIDTFGNVIPSLPSLYIDQVFTYMTYVPKTLLSLCRLTGCQNTPATYNQSAYDSFSIPVITLRSILPSPGYAISVAYIMQIPSANSAQQFQSVTGFHIMERVFLDEDDDSTTTRSVQLDVDNIKAVFHREGDKNKMRSMTSNDRSKSDYINHTSPLSSSRQLLQTNNNVGTGNDEAGTYYFQFLINDFQNPSPPKLVNVTVNQTIGNYTFPVILSGYQIVMRFYLTTGTGLPTNANISSMENYVTRSLPPILSSTLKIDQNQIIDFEVDVTRPINSLNTNTNMKVAAHDNEFHSMEVSQTKDFQKKVSMAYDKVSDSVFETSSGTTLLTPPLYATFVIIANPNITSITSEMLADEFLSTDFIAQLLANLLGGYMVLDDTFPVTTVQVYVQATSWYLHGPTGTGNGNGGFETTEGECNDNGNANCWNPLWSLLGVFLFVCVAVGLCYVFGCCDSQMYPTWIPGWNRTQQYARVTPSSSPPQPQRNL